MMSKQIPKFKNEDEEREFWATHDSTEFINWNQAERVTFSNLKPSVKKISLRLPESRTMSELRSLLERLLRKSQLIIKHNLLVQVTDSALSCIN